MRISSAERQPYAFPFARRGIEAEARGLQWEDGSGDALLDSAANLGAKLGPAFTRSKPDPQTQSTSLSPTYWTKSGWGLWAAP